MIPGRPCTHCSSRVCIESAKKDPEFGPALPPVQSSRATRVDRYIHSNPLTDHGADGGVDTECGEIRGWGREERSRDEFFSGVLSMPYAGSLNAGTV